MELYDIVIVGAGPVGLVLSSCLARWGYKIKHIDNRAEPTATGRADGIQPRSLEMLKIMGLKSQLFSFEPARVYEVAFWDPASNGIVRTGTWASCPKFIDARYPFTALLHQGLIERTFIADLARNNTSIQRPWTIQDFTNDALDPDYPVEVTLGHVENTSLRETVRAKYLFSGEGAKSFVRNKLNIPIHHKDPISHVWGVMDGVVRTNFPDIKMKCTIHSDAGSIMVIPRESNMVRLYIQLASSTDPDFDPRKTATIDEVQQAAQRIFKPYHIQWETVEWYSVYPIGQGIAERYTLDNRVLMGGDACHTHSPKAGQGMNAAFLDAQNLSWKIHGVEAGFLQRSVLSSYESERKYIAEALLDFDARYAKLFSTRQPGAGEVGSANQSVGTHSSQEENPFVKTFKENCEFTSGYGVAYQTNIFNWSPDTHPAQSPLFLTHPHHTPLRPGRILPPVTTTRIADANVINLEQAIPMNGSFRIYIFAGRPHARDTPNQALVDFANASMRPSSYLGAHLRRDIATISHHERHNPHSHFFTFCTIFAAHRPDVELDLALPPLLSRYRDHVYADDVWDQRVPDAAAAGHAKMLGGEWAKGGEGEKAVVVVRPDSYVGCVVRLVEGTGTVDALDGYFGSFARGIGNMKEVRAQL